MFVIKKNRGETVSLPAKEINPTQLRAMQSPLAVKILRELARQPLYPKAIARKLSENEQKIYYHIRKLEKAGIIKEYRTEQIGGAQAVVYQLNEPAFAITFKEFQTTQKLLQQEKPDRFIVPFVEDGQLQATIVVGSPDPHGPEKARSRDGYYGMDFAIFLGTFLNYLPDHQVLLDTEVRSETLRNNLIIIGGPITNTLMGKVNDKLPVKFDKKAQYNVVSKLSGQSYPSDEVGIIVKAKNPFNPKKFVLVLAGKRHSGTKAVMIALIKHYKEIVKGNTADPKILAKVVEGVDMDADGIVDAAEFLE